MKTLWFQETCENTRVFAKTSEVFSNSLKTLGGFHINLFVPHSCTLVSYCCKNYGEDLIAHLLRSFAISKQEICCHGHQLQVGIRKRLSRKAVCQTGQNSMQPEGGSRLIVCYAEPEGICWKSLYPDTVFRVPVHWIRLTSITTVCQITLLAGKFHW